MPEDVTADSGEAAALRKETLDRFYAFRAKAEELEEGGFVRRTRGNTIHLRWSKRGLHV